MQINETTYNAMPAHLRALFVKLPNPGKDEVLALFPGEGDKSAARFMYCAKASKRDRDDGLDGFEAKRTGSLHATTKGQLKDLRLGDSYERPIPNRANTHPTVKPTDLMRYLCRLVTPPGGVVLDPFTGSGSTGKAAMLEGFQFIGCELDQDEKGNPLGYSDIAKARIVHAWKEWCEGRRQGALFDCVEAA